jgi:hypothetical protein
VVETVARALRAENARSVRAAALLVAAAAAGVALWHVPGRFRAVNGEVSRFAALTPAERHLWPARSLDVDTAVYVVARRVIALRDPYSVVVGNGVSVSTPTILLAVAPFAGYYLNPRPQVLDPKQARWVISYGGDLARLGVRTGRVVDVEPGVQIAEVLG